MHNIISLSLRLFVCVRALIQLQSAVQVEVQVVPASWKERSPSNSISLTAVWCKYWYFIRKSHPKNWNILFLKYKCVSIDQKLMKWRHRGKCYYLFQTKQNNGLDCTVTSRPAGRNKQMNHVIQAECSRSTQTLSVPDKHDPNFSLITPPPPPSSLQAPLLEGHEGTGIWSATDDGWIPRWIWGEMWDAARSLAHSSIFFLSILRPNEDEERGV